MPSSEATNNLKDVLGGMFNGVIKFSLFRDIVSVKHDMIANIVNYLCQLSMRKYGMLQGGMIISKLICNFNTQT